MDPQKQSLGWAIANALSVIAQDSDFDDIKELALDKKKGQAREMLALALANIKAPQSGDVLMQLLADEEMVGHAIMALGKLRECRALPLIEKSLNHPRPWIRNEAKKAIGRINKSSGNSSKG